MAEESERVQDDELENAEGEVLPEREVMSVVSSGFDEPMPLPVLVPDDQEPLRGGEKS